MSSRAVVFVHAHPDDEALTTGGTIAHYASGGVHVCLVTCTNGDLGEIAELDDLPSPEELRPRLGEVRAEELEEACRILGLEDLRMLGFRDSGMEGTPGNHDPASFVNQDIEVVVARLVEIVRDVRPQVIVTYDESGQYGHPDHIRAHQATMRAVKATADASYGSGRTHTVDKVYYTAYPRSLMRMGREMAHELGLSADEFFTESDVERIGVDDSSITTKIDVSAFVGAKFRALEAHRTQLGTTAALLAIPPEVRELALGTEHYVLGSSSLPFPTAVETDLFEGLG